MYFYTLDREVKLMSRKIIIIIIIIVRWPYSSRVLHKLGHYEILIPPRGTYACLSVHQALFRHCVE